MKKILALCLFSLCLLSWLTGPAIGESADDIVKKMIDALGGRKALEAVQDATMAGTMELTQMGLSATVTSYRKNPNKTRMDIEVMGMVITQAFDGETAWMVNPQTGSSEELPEQFAEYSRRDSIGDEAYLNPGKHGITYTLKGKETIEGKEYLVLEQAFADGYKASLYVDPKTYLVYKSKGMALNQMQIEVEQETVQTDYKEINGLMVPHTITIYQDGEEFGLMNITEVKYNTGLEDSFFEMQ